MKQKNKVITYSHLKELYFKYRDDDQELDLSEGDREAIKQYLKHVEKFEDKRNWENEEVERENAEMMAEEILGESN